MRLDVVIPAHNEEQRIGRTLSAYRRVCSEDDVRFIVALDDCVDDTERVVRRHMVEDPRVQGLNFTKLGKGGVIMETFRRCDADLIGFVDADCATPPAEFLRLVDAAERADGAIASRYHPASVIPGRRPFARRMASAAFARLIRRAFKLPFSDTQCGAKVLRREVVHASLPFVASRDFLFDVDLLYVARRIGYRIVEVPTIWVEREGSRVSAGSDGRRMAASALRLWLHHKVIPFPERTEPTGTPTELSRADDRPRVGAPV